MRNRKVISIVSLLIPVAVAAINELTDQIENKRRDREMEELKQRVRDLEHNE